MSIARRTALIVVWMLSLVGVAVWARADGQDIPVVAPVFSGADLGFRAIVRDGKPIGRLVVRIDGKWVDVQFAQTIVPARE
jgi:hypothetical protein